jgi:predicted metal-dependent phosphoesterase TrpH
LGKADLHAHTCHDAWGDGNQSVEELFRYVEEHTDLDLFAVTDHDSTGAARAAWEIHRRGGYRFGFLPGVEVTNRSGHLLCYFPSGQVVDIPSLRPFWWTVRYARAHGGISVVAHPIYPPWVARSLLQGSEDGVQVDAVEAINAGLGERAQQRLDQLARSLTSQVALVGNSDAHHQAAVGAAYTAFPGRTVEDFLLALQQRTTKPVLVCRPEMPLGARTFTTRRSMTRPGWVRNLWRELSS